MATVKTLAVAAALIAGAISLALAQNGPPTGGEPPVAGGAAGNASTGGTMGKSTMSGKTTAHKTMKKESKPQ